MREVLAPSMGNEAAACLSIIGMRREKGDDLP